MSSGYPSKLELQRAIGLLRLAPSCGGPGNPSNKQHHLAHQGRSDARQILDSIGASSSAYMRDADLMKELQRLLAHRFA